MAGILLNRSRQAPAEETPAFGGIAERFRRAGDLDRAIALCRDGLKKFPDQLSARVTLGWALLDKGQYEDARAELERVLRKAPDNLAAIRGLAELHDRSEGAMPAETWHPDDAEPATPASAASPAPVAPVASPVAPVASVTISSSAPSPALAANDDPFAPIAVSLPATDATSSPELLHTAEQAGRAAEEAAAEFDLLGTSLDQVAPVEIEDPAAASMAAAGATVASDSQSSIELDHPLDVDGSADDVEKTIANLGHAGVTFFDQAPASPQAPESSQDTIEFDSADVSFETFDAGHSSNELDDAIRSLDLDRGPAIDFGTAGEPAAEEPDPEIAAAARALEAISFDDARADAEHVPALDATPVNFEPHPVGLTQEFTDLAAADTSELELVVDSVDTATGLDAEIAAPAPTSSTVENQSALGSVDVDELAAAHDQLALEPPDQLWSDKVIASEADEESFGKAAGPVALPEAPLEPSGPVFELTAPDLAAEGAIEEELDEGVDLGARDQETADLFAMMTAETEPPADLFVRVPSDEEIAAELRAIETDRPDLGAAVDVEAPALEAEHFVDVADPGPAWVPDPSDLRPVVEQAAASAISEMLADVDAPPVGVGRLGLSTGSAPLRHQSGASLVALERLLKKVEARRLQLQSESVA